MLRQRLSPLEELSIANELTQNGRIDISKACLSVLEKTYHIPNTTGYPGYALFLHYFASFNLAGEETNFAALRRTPRLERIVRKQLYQADSIKESPGYFNIKKHQDLNRLSKLLGINTVVYFVNKYNIPSLVEIWHDFRALSFSVKPTVYFAVTPEGQLKMLSQSLDSCRTLPLYFATESIRETTLAKALERLLQLEPCVPQDSDLHYESCQKLIQKAEALTEHYGLTATNIILVAFCKNTQLCKNWDKRHLRTKPSSNIFLRVASLGPSILSKEDVDNAILVCVTGDLVCRLKPQFEQHLKTNMKLGYSVKETLLDKPDDDKFFSKQIPKLRATEVASAKSRFFEKRERSRRLRLNKARKTLQKQKRALLLDANDDDDDDDDDDDEQNVDREKKIKLICDCRICMDSLKTFGSNMNRHGRERLMQVPLDIRDLLAVLGLDSTENLNIIEELCQMTIAAFDIESMTVGSDIEPPAACIANPPNHHSQLGGLGGSYVKSLQKPIMIAHTDFLSKNDPKSMLLLTLQSDAPSAIFSMMQNYWESILARKKIVCQKKRVLADPLLAALRAYKEEHDLFMDTRLHHKDNESNLIIKAKQNFKHTLPGQLMAKIEKLISDYVVFSFYGSGYDHVLLEGLLTCYLFEQKQKPILEKNGNKVTVLRTSSGIVFRDVCKLLAPNTSLRNFGKLFDLEQEKAHFPFKILTGVAALSIPNLPRDLHMWTSDITSRPMSLEAVEEAVSLFRQLGCKNVGDYLKHYLQLDVDILYKATNSWRRHLKEVINLDFIEARKYTVSSLSYLASGKANAKLKRPGSFFPNNAQHYGLLKKGMRG